ncbi:MAG: thiamine pyrophosphate-binding protein [Fusobacterium sp. JB019]|nr:thiamine pyrophosphate-binding protein [Fusobacterium sp. JB019]
MKASDYIVKFFEEKKVEIVFGYIGGMITHLVDSIHKNKNVKFVQTYHEQSAAIAAEGYARETQNIGVAISTSGPGATNMMTGIANAYFDSIPVIYITGQVNTYDYKYNKPIKQQGFQETDIISIVKPITKYAKLIDNSEKLVEELEKAYEIATTGRKGPVLLDIPLNIQRANIELIKKIEIESKDKILDNLDMLEKTLDIVKNSKAPILLIGGGFISENAKELLEEFVKKTGIPVVNSLLGKGCFSELENEHMGLIGSYGNRCANIAVYNSDCLLTLGSRLDLRQTGNFLEKFSENKKIIHVDIDEKEMKYSRLKNKINLKIRAKDYLNYLNDNICDFKISESWKNYLKNLKENYSQAKEIEKNVENKMPYEIIDLVNKYSKEGDIITADIGQNQMWAAQYLKIKKDQKWYTSGGLAPMGYSLPAAVGAAFANKGNDVFAIMGDGGFHMSTQSLMLISQYNLPVKVIVLNNNALGMITQFQELYFQNVTAGTTNSGGYYVPNLENMAKSYNLKYFKLDKKNMFDNIYLDKIFKIKNAIIEVILEGETRVYPKLEYDCSIENTSPKLSEEELKKLKFKK